MNILVSYTDNVIIYKHELREELKFLGHPQKTS